LRLPVLERGRQELWPELQPLEGLAGRRGGNGWSEGQRTPYGDGGARRLRTRAAAGPHEHRLTRSAGGEDTVTELERLGQRPVLLEQLRRPRPHRLELLLELQDALDPGQADALLRELLHRAQLPDVARGVAAAAAPGALRGDQTQPVVLPQRLGVQAGQLRSDGGDVDGCVLVGAVLPCHRQLLARWMSSARGSAPSSSAASTSTASRALSVRRCGTTMLTFASRSPVPLLALMPRPLTRSTRPEGVPAATLTLTVPPSRVGTCTVAPRAASANVTGRSTVRLLPSRPKTGCGRTVTTSMRSPAGAPGSPAIPLPRRRIFCPSLTPAGMRVVIRPPS